MGFEIENTLLYEFPHKIDVYLKNMCLSKFNKNNN